MQKFIIYYLTSRCEELTSGIPILIASSPWLSFVAVPTSCWWGMSQRDCWMVTVRLQSVVIRNPTCMCAQPAWQGMWDWTQSGRGIVKAAAREMHEHWMSIHPKWKNEVELKLKWVCCRRHGCDTRIVYLMNTVEPLKEYRTSLICVGAAKTLAAPTKPMN